MDQRGGQDVLITFNEMFISADGSKYWADKLAGNLGKSCIGFITKSANWFPQNDMMSAARAIEPYLREFSTRTLYGFSQGGYASIKYSKLLRADHVLAFSPQYSIDPATIEDGRFSKHYKNELHKGMEISGDDVSGNIWIFVDPYDKRDKLHCDLILHKIPQGIIIPVNRAGHASVRAVASTAGFSRLVAASHVKSAKEGFQIVKEEKKKSIHYLANLGMVATRRKHLCWATGLHHLASQTNATHHVVEGLKRALDVASIS